MTGRDSMTKAEMDNRTVSISDLLCGKGMSERKSLLGEFGMYHKAEEKRHVK
jgi:hypothetical protein